MNEIQISTISKNYARALLESTDKNSLDKIKNQLKDVLDIIDSSADLKIVMENYSISVYKKEEIISEIFESRVDKKIFNLLKILVEKNRFLEIYSIYDAFVQNLDRLSNKKHVEIVSSVELNGALKDRILAKLQNKLNCEIVPNWQIDESIIAGLEFKFDDYVIDSSVRSKLKVLGKNISR